MLLSVWHYVTYITTFKTIDKLFYSLYYTSWDNVFYLKTDCACKIDIKIPVIVYLKKDLSVCTKFLFIIHVQLHWQNSIYLNFLYKQKMIRPKL